MPDFRIRSAYSVVKTKINIDIIMPIVMFGWKPVSSRACRIKSQAAVRRMLLPMAVSVGLGLLSWVPADVVRAAQPQGQTADQPVRVANASAVAGRRQYDIPGGSLDQVLNRFADAAGIQVLADAELTAGKTASGLKGTFSVEEGLRMLLAQYGIEARRGSQANIWSLRRAPVWRQPGAVSSLTPVRVRGASPKERIFDAPNSNMVITREEIQRIAPRNLDDVFHETPGVFAKNARASPVLMVNIRGIEGDSRNSMMIDGARQNFQRTTIGGTIYGMFLDPALVRQVDVAKGANTGGDGSVGTIGGKINFRTLEFEDVVMRPDARFGGMVSVGRGSNAIDLEASAGVGSKLGDWGDFVAVASKRRYGNYELGTRPERAERSLHTSKMGKQDSESLLTKVRWNLSPASTLKLGFVGFRQYEKGDTITGTGDTRQWENNVDTYTIKGDYAYKPAGNMLVDLNASLYYTLTNMDVYTVSTNAEQHFETNTLGGKLMNTSLWERGRSQYELRYGGEFFHDWTDPRAAFRNSPREISSVYSDTTPKGQRTLSSLMLDGTWSHQSGFEVSAGLRLDRYQLKGKGKYTLDYVRNEPGQTPQFTQVVTGFNVNRHETFIAPRITLSYRPPAWQGVQFFAGWNQGSRPPTITESLLSVYDFQYELLPNPGLDPEHARHFEVGVNLKAEDILAKDDKFGAKLSLFHTKMTDSIVLANLMGPLTMSDLPGVCESNGMHWRQCVTPQGFTNYYGDITYRGLELHLSYDAGVAFGSLNFTRMLFGEPTGYLNYFPLGSMTGYPDPALRYPQPMIWSGLNRETVPGRSGNLNLGVRLLDKKLTLGWRLRFQRGDFHSAASEGHESAKGSYANWVLHDLYANYAILPNVNLRMSVTNLRNTSYGEITGEGVQLAPGRTAQATLSILF